MAGKGRMPVLAVLAALLLLTAACGSAAYDASHGGTRAGSSASISLTETGSSLLYPLMQTWTGQYHKQFPGVTVTPTSSNSGTGITDASKGTVDIGTSDAYLSSGDLVMNPSLLNIPLAISAQQVNYNVPGFNGGQHINLDGHVLALMYEGKITNWDDSLIAQLNPGAHLPSLTVVPIHRSDSSGDTFLFSSYLSTQYPAWNTAYGYGTTVAWPSVTGELAEKGNRDVVAKCAVTVGCVAYAGISFLTMATGDGLGYAALANAAGHPELPDAATIGASVASFVSSTPVNETISMVDGPAPDGYPIVNFEYAIVTMKQPDPARARAIRAFLSWVITSGNSATYLTQVHFAPLPSAVATLGTGQIGQIGQIG